MFLIFHKHTELGPHAYLPIRYNTWVLIGYVLLLFLSNAILQRFYIIYWDF